MAKYFVLLALLFSGCTDHSPKVGDCYRFIEVRNVRWMKVDKLKEFGLELEDLEKESGYYYMTYTVFNTVTHERIDCEIWLK